METTNTKIKQLILRRQILDKMLQNKEITQEEYKEKSNLLSEIVI